MKNTNSNLTGKYILKGKKVIEEPDLMKWAQWMEYNKERIVARTIIKGYLVSTVFLGLDQEIWMHKETKNPLIFETMIFYEKNREKGIFNKIPTMFDDYQVRYRTYDDALKGHKEAVKYVKNSLK